MIESMHKPHPDELTEKILHPLFKQWFFKTFKTFSPPQRYSIYNVHSRVNTLVSSPTGSGKTLSAFGAILNELLGLSLSGSLEDKTYCIYISPLKALSRDIEINLQTPLAELEEIAGKKLGIRALVRTGDTTAYEKSKMLRHPPHILITTPESLAIVLTTIKFREKLRDVQWVIVDEIHSLAGSKRGVHLSLSLERLQRMTNFTRIGLSATVAPLEEVAKFLVGLEDPAQEKYRPCKIVDVQYLKKLDLKVLSPVENLVQTTHQRIHDATYELMDELIQKHRTTLVFTNTRSATERVVHHLKDKFPKNYTYIDEDLSNPTSKEPPHKTSTIGAHHGSLSKEARINLENRLKEGKLRAVVCSTSLELGIDIGYIDLVILLGSPKSVARALQRIGRSGHKLHDQAKGRILVMDRDDLVECAVLLKAALEKKIDRIDIPENCLDVLAQQILGIALEEPIHVDDLYHLLRQSYNYRKLARKDYDEIIQYLAGSFSSLEDRHVYAKIWYDADKKMIGKRGKMTRVIYMTNVGTIPDETNVKVKVGGQLIGSISEPFLERLKRGDVFVLGGETYEFQYAQGMTANVKASAHRTPTVPSWYSEMLPLNYDLALEILKFRDLMKHHLESSTKKETLEFIDSYLYVDHNSANSIYEYFYEQYHYADISTPRQIVIEHYTDENKKYLVFHTLYGRRVNDVLSRALGFIIGKIQGRDAEMGITDNGFYILASKGLQASRAFELLKSQDLDKIMQYALDRTEVLQRRFRHCAARALMILRSYYGRKKSVGRQQMSSRLLISAVRKISESFIILNEARREVLEDLMDIKHTREVLQGIENGSIHLKEIYTDLPSPFAFNIIAMGYSDIMKMEDKHLFLQRMHDMVLAKISLKKARQTIH